MANLTHCLGTTGTERQLPGQPSAGRMIQTHPKTMKTRLPISILLSLLTTAPLATANCDPLPTLEISDVRTTLVGNEWKEDRVIDATASKDGKTLPLAIVRLYIGKVLVEWTMADKRGHFLLENLTVGPYTLSIQGIGRFRLEVTPPRIHQQFFYGFSSNHGCLDWSETSN